MRFYVFAAAALLLAAPLSAQRPPPPTSEQIRSAEEALAAVDQARMEQDQAYAGTIADHLAVLRAAPGRRAEERLQSTLSSFRRSPWRPATTRQRQPRTPCFG
jgi:hypothetical protein